MIVRKLRLQRGWTQDQLSEISGLSIRTIQRLERGAKPSLETAKSLAAIFEVDFQSFQPWELDMNSPEKEPAVAEDEKSAMLYAKRVTEYILGAIVTLIVAGFLIYKEGPTEKLLLVLGALGIAMVIHGLFVFEILRFPTVNFERRLAERKLGRKL
jgi:transcriptional regulator with XRE-family HTH domain